MPPGPPAFRPPGPMYPPQAYPPAMYPPPPGPWPGAAAPGLPTPPFLRGVAAGVIDALTGLFVLGAWAMGVRVLARTYHQADLVAMAVPAVLLIAASAFEYLFSATLGELITGLRVRALDGRAPSRARLAVRCLIKSSPLWVGPGLIMLEHALDLRPGISMRFAQMLSRPLGHLIFGSSSMPMGSDPIGLWTFGTIYALNVGLLPAIFLFFGSLLGWGPGRLTLHDMITGTRVLPRGVGEAGHGFAPIVQPYRGPPVY